MWSKDSDIAPEVDNGQGGVSSMDVHPFVIVQSAKKTDDFAGIYFHSSNAISPILQFDDAPAETSTLSFVSTGGIVEVFIFGHGSHNDVVKMYHNIVGRPALPPYWALGFHQGSLGYTSEALMKTAIDGYKADNMPLESVWVDTAALHPEGKNFELSETQFPNLQTIVEEVHANGQRIVTQVQAGMSADDYIYKYL